MPDNNILQLQDKDLFMTEEITIEEKRNVVEEYLELASDYKELLPEFDDGFKKTKEALNDIKASLDKAIESVKKDNPKFKDMTTAELKDNDDFKQALLKSDMLRNIKNAIPKLNDNIALITDKKYKHALSPYKNPHAYIQQLDENFFQQLEFDPDNGTMNIKGNVLELITLQNAKTRSDLKSLDLPLLRSLYTVIYQYADKIDTDTVTIYLPTLTKHLGINIRGGKPNDLFSKIKAFDNVIGVENGSFYRLLTFLKYDKQTNSITFGSPYMNKILRTLREVNTVVKKEISFINPHYNHLIHGSISNEKNKYAVEIVCNIVTSIQQRGEFIKQKKDSTIDEINDSVKKIEKTMKRTDRNVIRSVQGDELDNSDYEDVINNDNNKKSKIERIGLSKKISTIVEQIPVLEEALNIPTIDKKTQQPKTKAPKEQNIILKRAFTRAYELLEEKTDIYKYYKDLQISKIIPSMKTIDKNISISHLGISENYKQENSQDEVLSKM